MLRSRPKRSALGAAGALTALLTAFAGTAPAQAAPAAVSPTVSPTAPSGHVPANSDYQCAPGNLCTLVWDPTTGDYKIFYLYTCARYSLSGWSGHGFYADNQTSGTRSSFYDANGRALKSFTADGGANHTQDWTPVRSIRNC
ncbi:hypothetical protein ACFVUH_32330 [Kitasatospora sp. NPDC058032]|uniref:hypothetical protein n=1 Tax=unclassified Kitasatospora TaxID=2633591 RepID=UPI0033B266B0